MDNEADEIIRRYQRRFGSNLDKRYAPLLSVNQLVYQERERALADMLRDRFDGRLSNLDILEIGCGTGNNLLDLIRLGASADKLVGNDLFPDALGRARERLPASLRLIESDASVLELAPESFDIVMHFTVFSSVLDRKKRCQIARKVWELVRPDGVILSYDFTWNSPYNPDVRKFTRKDVESVYPQGNIIACRRVTLAPPIARRVVQIRPVLYGIFNLLPFLRTHLLCMIEKPV